VQWHKKDREILRNWVQSYIVNKLPLRLQAIQGMPKTQSSMKGKIKLKPLSRYRVTLHLPHTVQVSSSCSGDIA